MKKLFKEAILIQKITLLFGINSILKNKIRDMTKLIKKAKLNRETKMNFKQF